MRNSGFSLVELSIVLVILGLLTGGILAGQNLIRAAELRSVPNEFQRYQTAVMTFRDKYFALPGDMRNAVRFWGAQAGGVVDGPTTACDALGFANPATGAATCNGDGDGRIASGWREIWRVWHHLSNAGLVEGSYTGVTGSATDSSFGVAGENVPRSKVDQDVGWSLGYTGSLNGHPTMFDGEYGNAWRLGGANGMDERSNLTAEEAWNIDTKMDDGRPGSGSMRMHKNSNRGNCASTDVVATAEYLLQNTDGGCNAVFISGF